MIRKESFVGH